MKMGMCMCAVRLGGLPIQCPGMAKSLAMPLQVSTRVRTIVDQKKVLKQAVVVHNSKSIKTVASLLCI